LLCLSAGNPKERRQGGGEGKMKISTIEMLAPAANGTKGN
jgi:hypothetical protein